MRSKPETVKDALMMSARAAVKREIADNMAERGDYHASVEREEADSMDAAAAHFLDQRSHALNLLGPLPPDPGNGGELLMLTRDLQADVPGLVDTVRERPSMLAAEASETRLRLTGNSLVLAVDAAESIKARNSLEKMLAHELAAAHRLAMHLAEQSARLVDWHESWGKINNQAHTIEAARLANASARMMGAFQDGLLTLERIRRGGKQTVKVVHQHVAVGPGGQAVVAAGGVRGRGHAVLGLVRAPLTSSRTRRKLSLLGLSLVSRVTLPAYVTRPPSACRSVARVLTPPRPMLECNPRPRRKCRRKSPS